MYKFTVWDHQRTVRSPFEDSWNTPVKMIIYTHNLKFIGDKSGEVCNLAVVLLNCRLCSKTAYVQFAIKWKYVLVTQERGWSWRILSSLESEEWFSMAIMLCLKLIKGKSEQTSECWFVCASLNPHKKWLQFFLVKCASNCTEEGRRNEYLGFSLSSATDYTWDPR